MTDTYNGWPNRWTWLVHLWLTNEEHTYQTAVRVVADQLHDAEGDEPRALTMAADALADLVRTIVDDDVPGGTLAADLVGHAAGQVDYRAVADALAEHVDRMG